MGNAFIEGLSHSAENQIHVVEPNSSVKAKLKIDFDVTVSNYDDPEKQMGEIIPLCEYVLLCVKPQVFNKIKKIIAPDTPGNIIADTAITEQKKRYIRLGSTLKLFNCVIEIDTVNDTKR